MRVNILLALGLIGLMCGSSLALSHRNNAAGLAEEVRVRNQLV